MRLLYFVLFSLHLTTFEAFAKYWHSDSNALSTLGLMSHDNNVVTLHPINPEDSDQITRTSNALDIICGTEHVTKQQAADGRVSWVVTLTHREHIDLLPDHPWLNLDSATNNTLIEFSKESTRRSILSSRDEDPLYDIRANDYTNDEETKATREFLKTKTSAPDQKFVEIHLPGTTHILSWGGVQLSDTAKAEVEAYMGREDRPLQLQGPTYEDRAVITDSSQSIKERRIRTAFGHLAKRASIAIRAITWTKQQKAGWDLVMVSKPR
jgi:hypothetical protein